MAPNVAWVTSQRCPRVYRQGWLRLVQPVRVLLCPGCWPAGAAREVPGVEATIRAAR